MMPSFLILMKLLIMPLWKGKTLKVEYKGDDASISNARNITESIDNNEDSNNEVRNEDDSDGNLLMDDDEEIPIERKHPSRFNVEDQRPYFTLGMTLKI